jgi:hypothetical protein
MARSLLALIAAPASLFVIGCGSAPPPPPEAAPQTTSQRPRRSSTPDIQADIGGLNADDVQRAFQKLMPRIEQCQDDRRKEVDKLDFLAGDVSIEVHVDGSGQAKDAFLARTTLGDRATEKCIIDAVKKSSWPKPVGGREGIAKSDFQLPMKGERDAVAWDKGKVAENVNRAKSAFRSCSSGGGAEITAYVDSDGKVISAGASQTKQGGDAAADCLAAATKGVKMPSPGGWPAKVTFTLD